MHVTCTLRETQPNQHNNATALKQSGVFGQSSHLSILRRQPSGSARTPGSSCPSWPRTAKLRVCVDGGSAPAGRGWLTSWPKERLASPSGSKPATSGWLRLPPKVRLVRRGGSAPTDSDCAWLKQWPRSRLGSPDGSTPTDSGLLKSLPKQRLASPVGSALSPTGPIYLQPSRWGMRRSLARRGRDVADKTGRPVWRTSSPCHDIWRHPASSDPVLQCANRAAFRTSI